MEDVLTITRTDLIAAFTRWHAACETKPDGNLVGETPDDPAQMADILIGHLKAGADA